MLANSKILILQVVYILISIKFALAQDEESAFDRSNYAAPCVTPAELALSYGFLAEEFFVESSTGNVLRVTRIGNPLFDNGTLPSKDPMLFLHGLHNMGSSFLINDPEARPKDFSNISLTTTDLDELNRQLSSDPSSGSLCLLGSNFGHECWILDRRGSPGSQEIKGDPSSIKALPGQRGCSTLASVIPDQLGIGSTPSLAKQIAFADYKRFWNFSLDEQALFDFPAIVKHILNHTKSSTSRVAVVGHSAGGAITLMALSANPDLLPKLSTIITWSASFVNFGDNPGFNNFMKQADAIQYDARPIPPPANMGFDQAYSMIRCIPPSTWATSCPRDQDQKVGPSGGKAPYRPRVFAALNGIASSREIGQRGQIRNYSDTTMHRFNYGEEGNLIAYGQATPPLYNLSTIGDFARSVSFYVGDSDYLTPAEAIKKNHLQVPQSQFHMINGTFNHMGWFFNLERARLAVIPSMREIELLAPPVNQEQEDADE